MPALPILKSGDRLIQHSLNGPRWPMALTPEGLQSLQSVLDELLLAALIVDAQGQVQVSNEPARALFGIDPQAPTIGIDSLVPHSMRDAHRVYRQVYSSVPQARAMSCYPRLPARRADGSALWAQIELTPFWTSDGVWTAAMVREVAPP